VAGEPVNSTAELQEKVNRFRPGDDVKIVVKRKGERKQFNVTLRNKHGDTQIVRDNVTVLGARFEAIRDADKRNLNIEFGIKIVELNRGKLKDAGLNEGFIVTHVNKKPMYDVNDFKREIGNARGGVLVEGVYPNGELAYFVFGVD
jgi:serine protease Do